MGLAETVYHHLYMRRRRRFDPALSAQAATSILPCKTISIGNLTTGGTGKTPAVQWVARRLQVQGIHVAVVARGYGGRLSREGAVVSDGAAVLHSAHDVGDEPVLHARALPGIPVIIGRDRVVAARLAAERFGVQVVVLDDAFQYWSLHRDLNVVLMDARRPFDNGHLLPRGRLREPPAALERADVVLLTRADLASEEQRSAARAQIGRYTPAPIFEASHAPTALRDEVLGERMPLHLEGMSVAAVSALADNEAFQATVQACGARIVAGLERRDHHHWQPRELQTFAREAERAGAQALITTEKDAVKIQPNWLPPLPFWSLCIELRLGSDEAAFQALVSAVCAAAEKVRR